jgi:pimeloyl-ACP methyl ester carboxylesterase
MRYKLLFLILAIAISSCTAQNRGHVTFKADVYLYGVLTRVDTLTLYDSVQKRAIPITIYTRDDAQRRDDMLHKNIKRKLVILNPGYGGTRADYSYIASDLAVNDYLVVTIQHDLPTDDTLPGKGDIYKLRKPFWDRGVKNILFVTAWLKKEYPKLNYKNITLIGHSNGGDIAMLMATEYPDFAKAIISLDNRRMPIPRASHPKIYSLRSSDQPADPGVLPAPEEQKKYHIKIIDVDVKHNDMGGTATDDQKKQIKDYINDFLGVN